MREDVLVMSSMPVSNLSIRSSMIDSRLAWLRIVLQMVMVSAVRTHRGG
jgi:hypothetical protein